MARDDFWSNREQAQKLIDEAGSIRKKTEPLLKAGKQFGYAALRSENR